jgi:16S rRNA (adenine1518-N6/adenine1519-N6)-dimethyltransferase
VGRRLGQHWLCDRAVAAQIIDLLRPAPDDGILEIGGGRGALTEHLASRGSRRVVVELDRGLAAGLRMRFAPGIEVLAADVLHLSLAELDPERRWLVVGNLPYYATSPILLWLCQQWRQVERALVMMQLEVAQRLTAEPGGRDYGRLSVAVAYRAAARVVLKVKPGSFVPPPAVQSAVVRLDFYRQPPVAVGSQPRFEALVEAGFRFRRKTLATALTMAGAGPRAAVEGWLAATGIDPRRRAETLELAEWAALSRAAETGP